MKAHKTINFAFFGSSHFSVIVLDELERTGLIPALVVTTPDKSQGRHMEVLPSPVKVWASKRKIEVFDPAKLDAEPIRSLSTRSSGGLGVGWEVFIVASYGMLIPQEIIDIPVRKTLNIHPSILPKYRGPSPLQSAMLADDKKTGVTIIRIDKQMDHGPIVAQEEVMINEWPSYEDLEELMAQKGAGLLARILPDWVAGRMIEKPQNEAEAAYTKKIKKNDALLDMSDDPYRNFRKIQAYHGWPQAYFFVKHKGRDIRIKVTRASFKEGALVIEKVVPEAGKEMRYDDFKRGYKIS